MASQKIVIFTSIGVLVLIAIVAIYFINNKLSEISDEENLIFQSRDPFYTDIVSSPIYDDKALGAELSVMGHVVEAPTMDSEGQYIMSVGLQGFGDSSPVVANVVLGNANYILVLQVAKTGIIEGRGDAWQEGTAEELSKMIIGGDPIIMSLRVEKPTESELSEMDCDESCVIVINKLFSYVEANKILLSLLNDNRGNKINIPLLGSISKMIIYGR